MTAIELLGDEPTQWLVIIKPKIRYADRLQTYLVNVMATDAHAALYAAKLAHSSVFNTLDSRYHDPVARPATIGVLRILTPHITTKGYDVQ